MKYLALSVVQNSGRKIAIGQKTLEIRSWKPEQVPLKNLVIVENTKYLNEEGDEDEGVAVAIVDVESIHEWQSDEMNAACALVWQKGYYAWVLSNIRPIDVPIKAKAKRKIYLIDINYP